MPVGQEAVFAVRLQQEISCGGQRARFREGQEVLEPEAPVNTVTSKVWETGERPEIPQKPRSGWKGRLSPACERGTHVDPPPRLRALGPRGPQLHRDLPGFPLAWSETEAKPSAGPGTEVTPLWPTQRPRFHFLTAVCGPPAGGAPVSGCGPTTHS